MSNTPTAPFPDVVTVLAPARLHMGFMDPAGTLGRQFGSIGVALREIATRITLRPAEHFQARGLQTERALRLAERLRAAYGLPGAAEIEIIGAIPEHVGLGSGTQLALALGTGLCHLYGRRPDVRSVARAIQRGARSGIGIAAFEQGGFIVDGGRGPHTLTPPLLCRMDVPKEWRFLLVFDERGQGLHGASETLAFQTLAPFPAEQAARLCHLLLMRGLPALAERDLHGFGSVIAEVQRAVGDYFSPAQGGRFTSQAVAEALDWLATQGAVGIGQTSWGPTGFCLVDNPEAAERLATRARKHYAGATSLSFAVASARNSGAELRVDPHTRPQSDRAPIRPRKTSGS